MTPNPHGLDERTVEYGREQNDTYAVPAVERVIEWIKERLGVGKDDDTAGTVDK